MYYYLLLLLFIIYYYYVLLFIHNKHQYSYINDVIITERMTSF